MAAANASYVKLVTPWGSVHLSKGFLEQLAVSVGVIVLTVMLWRCAARLNETLKKKTEANEEDEKEEEEEGEEDDDETTSTPDEKLIKKGENSYYYAHESKNVDKTMVSSYGWSDNKKTVSIYLTDNVIKNLKEEQLVLKWTKTSLSMDILKAPGGAKAKSLEISTLFQDITDATWKAEKDTLTVTLTKAQEKPWNSLNGAAKAMEDHIEYDDAFYD
ncbi:hypothetical protein P3T76_004947 [Phytophthora citrophthora]|uniref:CS domain-containing protein n=1 Tax=Phytophthora citrophthora TaxID=4793 RepID=A0AAD9LPE1_9STRA|nr:hypothetical protein P3T76_004947 [Phytophthora citrophthora]